MFENLIGKKNLSLDRLATLCHVAEAGSIGAAVGDNANRQSLYSRQISELESFLGIDLLDRHSKPYRVSEQGLELSRMSRNYLSALDAFVSTCQNRPQKLVIGAGESLIQWLLIPGVLPALKKSLPGTSVIFRNLRTEAIIDALQNGEIDLGFVRDNAVRGGLMKKGDFVQDYRAFVPRKFRVKLKSPITLDQLAGIPMAVLEGEGQYRTTLDKLASETGAKLNIVTECSSSTQVALLVARKECCAVLPSFARSQLDPATIDNYEVKGVEPLTRRLCFAWSPKRAEILPLVGSAVEICSNA